MTDFEVRTRFRIVEIDAKVQTMKVFMAGCLVIGAMKDGWWAWAYLATAFFVGWLAKKSEEVKKELEEACERMGS